MAYKNSKAQSAIGVVLGIGAIAGTTVPTGITATTVSASTGLTAVSAPGAAVGMGVSGAGIPSGTTVAAIGSGTITLSAPATASASAVALTFTLGYLPIFELSAAPVSGQKWDIEDTSNFQSGIYKEYLKTMLDDGKMALAGNRVSTDAGQTALKAAFLDPANAYGFQITYPLEAGQTTGGDTEVFNALVESYDETIQVGKVIKISISLQRTGVVTFTEGS